MKDKVKLKKKTAYVGKKEKLMKTEETNFLEIRQNLVEAIKQYVHMLKEALRYCELDKLGTGLMSIEEELIQ